MRGRYLTIAGLVLLVGPVGAGAPGCGGEGQSKDEEPPAHIAVGKPEPRDAGLRAKMRSGFGDAELLVRISFTRGERSRDSYAVQTHITLAGDELYFVRTPTGRRRGGALRASHKMTLIEHERETIEQRIRDLGLMEMASINSSSMPRGPHGYASASVELRLDGGEHEFRIAGVTSLSGEGQTAFVQTDAYRAVQRLVDEISAAALRDLEQGD